MLKLNGYTPGEVEGNGILFISRCTALFDISFAVVSKRKRILPALCDAPFVLQLANGELGAQLYYHQTLLHMICVYGGSWCSKCRQSREANPAAPLIDFPIRVSNDLWTHSDRRERSVSDHIAASDTVVYHLIWGDTHPWVGIFEHIW